MLWYKWKEGENMKNMEQRKAMRIGPVQMSGNGFSRKKGRGTDTSASFGIPVAVSFGERERGQGRWKKRVGRGRSSQGCRGGVSRF